MRLFGSVKNGCYGKSGHQRKCERKKGNRITAMHEKNVCKYDAEYKLYQEKANCKIGNQKKLRNKYY